MNPPNLEKDLINLLETFHKDMDKHSPMYYEPTLADLLLWLKEHQMPKEKK